MNAIAKCVMGILLGTIAASARASESECQPKNYNELVACADKSSSTLQVLEQRVRTANELESIARQSINPELEADSVYQGFRRSETTIALLFTVRLGGKRDALIREAKSEIERANATRDLSVNEAKLNTMLSFYRLSQLKSEIHLAEETIQTFSKVVGQFEKRPALTPEQDVSVTVFRMALADNKLRLTRLKNEEDQIYRELEAITGLSRAVVAANLPGRKTTWPDAAVLGNAEASPQIREAQAAFNAATSLKDKADADAWPDLRIGPSVRTTTDGSERTTYVGLGVTIPLPVLTTNEGNRSYQTQRVIEADLALSQARKKVEAARQTLLDKYRQTVATLKGSFSVNTLDEKHERVERQFFKGLVPSALVIEAHRQLFDFEASRNSSELEALEAFGQLLILNNKFSGVAL